MTKRRSQTPLQNAPQLRWIIVLLILFANANTNAASSFGLYFKFKSTVTGTVLSGTYAFDSAPNLLYSSGETCPSSHKDPNGLNYEHGHSFEAFDFWVSVGGTPELVTVAKSDEAWDTTTFIGYSRDINSSFLANCYAVAAGSPTPMSKSGWYSWTVGATFCHNNSVSHSYFVSPDHVVVYGVFNHYAGCELVSTQEKFASSGKYSMTYIAPNWGPMPTGEKRKRI